MTSTSVASFVTSGLLSRLRGPGRSIAASGEDCVGQARRGVLAGAVSGGRVEDVPEYPVCGRERPGRLAMGPLLRDIPFTLARGSGVERRPVDAVDGREVLD